MSLAMKNELKKWHVFFFGSAAQMRSYNKHM
jgi:hypothetical protein